LIQRFAAARQKELKVIVLFNDIAILDCVGDLTEPMPRG